MSSKMAELAPERAAIKEVLNGLNIDAWVFEQDAGARPETIQESYTHELEASDLYVGVFWKGYGEYTLEEFEHARKTGKDCLVYQKGDRLPDRDPQLQAFLDRIGKVETGLTVQYFDTAEQLGEMVKRDAARWQMRIVRKYRESGPQRAAANLTADPNLAYLRNRVQQFWIDGVLGRSIDAGFVDLSKMHRPEATDHPLEAVLELPYEGSRIVEAGASLLDIFDELQNSLLVLGQPGSGKTTTVLQLAGDLIKRSERDASQPVPVVLQLSTWSPQFPSLLAWMAKEISSKYLIPGRVSRPWLEQGRLVLILDGLDEVAAEAREACVGSVNRFCAEYGLAGLIVTSRLDEYDALPVHLRTNGAISLQPLSSQQIDAYLNERGGQLDGLRAVLETDETLQKLARSPLMLSVMSMAYRNRSAAELAEESVSAETRRAHLFETYVDRAFEERATARSYSREATTSWLAWLAKRMSRRNQTVFLIEDLQPSWLARRAELGAYLVGFAVLFGLVAGALCILFRWTPSGLPGNVGNRGLSGWDGLPEAFGWLASCSAWFLAIGLTDGMSWRNVKADGAGLASLRRVLANLVLFGLLWVPIMAVFVVLVDDLRVAGTLGKVAGIAIALTIGTAALCARRNLSRSIRTTESLRLNWARAGRGALWGLPVGFGFGAITLIVSASAGIPLLIVLWPLVTATFGAILAGLEPRVVKGKTVPNQGMVLTIRTSLRAGRLAISFVVLLIIACLLAGKDYLKPQLVAQWATATFLFFFVNLAMWFGGFDIGKHLLVRGLIGFTRQGPYDFARLLNDTSRRNLTQRVGGGYIFVHRLLLDHFAAMDLPSPRREDVLSADGERVRFPTPGWAMTLLALAGAAMLIAGVAIESQVAIVLGAILFGTGAQWLVIRTAVTSALRGERREREDE